MIRSKDYISLSRPGHSNVLAGAEGGLAPPVPRAQEAGVDQALERVHGEAAPRPHHAPPPGPAVQGVCALRGRAALVALGRRRGGSARVVGAVHRAPNAQAEPQEAC